MCPPLTTPQSYRELIGRKVLVAHERTKTLEADWYMGKIHSYGLSEAWQKLCPNANFLVKYTKGEAGDVLGGCTEAVELTAEKYGHDEWWLLLEKV